MKYLCILLWLLIMPYNVVCAQNEMPIIAFLGVPDSKTTDENFRTCSECGFNVSLSQYASLQSLQNACRIAVKYGIRILGDCPEMRKSPSVVSNALKKEDGFFGYYLKDEPSAVEIRQLVTLINELKKNDDAHALYINLLPYENPDWVLGNTKVKTYPEYLKIASSTGCQQISFDHYPIKTDGMCSSWYHNLEMVRKESIASGKPFWGFVMSVPHWHYPQPTMGSLRLQVYSNLAYGAQAIQYFTYWTPKQDSEGFNYRNGPVDNNGNKTNTYQLVKAVNTELKTIASLFYGAKVNSVNHLGVIPEGTYRLRKAPVNLKSLKIKAEKGVVISQFSKGEHKYLAVVNKDFQKPMTLNIEVKNSIPRHLTKDLQQEGVSPSYSIGPGDILLFLLQ